MTPTERIGELIANALNATRTLNGAALQQAIGQHLNIPGQFVEVDWTLHSDGSIRLTIEVP
jgi:hypothetical protein